ncbi:MAG: PDDEXK nuclease domain-containing protein [Bacteroidia bacterium]
MAKKKDLIQAELALFNELNSLIEQNHALVISQANSVLTQLFWKVGKRINEFVLEHKRAEYGKQIVVTLSRQFTERYGRNFEEKNLRRMLQFAAAFPDSGKVVVLTQHLSWSHFLAILPLKTEEQRLFYAQQAIQEHMGVRGLRKYIAKKVYERTAIANFQLPDTTHHLSDNFKDPYLLDFLNLPVGYLEFELETAILKELEKFIMEVGKGFAFVERQKRMIIDGEDHYLDLLFYHRKLKRLVAIELKIGKFHAKHKGQMELYLKWLNKHERQPGEETPVGLILCAETSREQVELLEMHKDGIIVAEYWTELPSRKDLEKRLHQAYLEAKEVIEGRKLLK